MSNIDVAYVERKWRELLQADAGNREGFLAACHIGGEYAETPIYETIEEAHRIGGITFPIYEINHVRGGQRRVIVPYVMGYALGKMLK